jgi:hypothetical protein
MHGSFQRVTLSLFAAGFMGLVAALAEKANGTPSMSSR